MIFLVEKKLGEFVKHVNVVCAGRVFGVTEKGWMGLFPRGCAVGDEVCLLEGAGVPLVIRLVRDILLEDKEKLMTTHERIEGDENDKEVNMNGEEEEGEKRPLYELVGLAYVHGIMDGEGMNEKGDTGRTLLK